MLSHSGLLGLAHRLLNVEPLPFGCISTEDCELMQIETVQEGRPCSRMPTLGQLTVYCSPQVTRVHLTADAIPLGLCIAGQQVSQLLVRLSDRLVVSLLGLLEHLLSQLNLRAVTSTVVETDLKIPRLPGDSSMPWTVSQQPWRALGTSWAAPSVQSVKGL
jgi:hypothetical protein